MHTSLEMQLLPPSSWEGYFVFGQSNIVNYLYVTPSDNFFSTQHCFLPNRLRQLLLVVEVTTNILVRRVCQLYHQHKCKMASFY